MSERVSDKEKIAELAKAIKMAIKRDPLSNYLPSTKGVL